MVSILAPVFLSLLVLVTGAVGARVIAQRLGSRTDPRTPALASAVPEDPNGDLPAYVDRTDAAAVAAFRRANLEVSQSWGKTY